MKIIVLQLILLSLFFTQAGMGQTQKFAYVNSAAILAKMPETKLADSELASLQKTFAHQGKDRADAFLKSAEDYQKKFEQHLLPPAQIEQERKKIEDERQKILGLENEMKEKLQTRRNELFEPILAKVNNAIKSVAKENGYLMIFDTGVLLFAEGELDASNLVLKKLGL